MFSRRDALKIGGLFGAGALASAVPGCGAATRALAAATPARSPIPSSGSSSPPALVGAWLDDITLGDGSRHQAVALYTEDGGVVSVPSLAAADFSTGLGAWSESEGIFTITTERFEFDSTGQAAGILRIRMRATIDEKSDQLIGHSLLDSAAIGASSFGSAGSAVVRSTRIKPVTV